MYKLLILLTLVIFTSCTKTVEVNKLCIQKPEAGNCRAYFERYYFNQETNQCDKFYWGGCAGSVPFKTISLCKKTCED